jgi:hypothetical protein
MTIDYSIPKKVEIKTLDFIDNLLLETQDDMRHGIAPSPAGAYHFSVNQKGGPLDKQKNELLHHITAKLLLLSCRAHPDLKTTMAS